MDDIIDPTSPSNFDLKTSLETLVKALPEIYQPIYGHPELSQQASRQCEDRLTHIKDVYRSLESKLNRPLHVLDLGCAQGFFSLHLAEIGAIVHAVDFQEVNIAVCQALAAQHPNYKVTFQTDFLEKVIIGLKDDQYDLVLGLSVFHHIIHAISLSAVQKMFIVLARKTAVGIFEIALASEPPVWAASQPKSPRTSLEGYAFVHEIARHRTHLSSFDRPLYFASNRYWFLNNQLEAFDSWTSESHAFANNASFGTRRYFFSNNLIAKLFYLDDQETHKNKEYLEANLWEYNNESKFLQNKPTKLQTPQLISHGKHTNEAWLVRERIPGELLIDWIRAGKTYNADLIIKEILEQLTLLEKDGFYHSDVRLWNILINPDGHVTLIDYSAISKAKEDCAWPTNIFLSFMISMHEIISSDVIAPDPVRSHSLNPNKFPEPYRHILWELFEKPVSEWSFSFLLNRLSSSPSTMDPSIPSSHEGMATIFDVFEDALNSYKSMLDFWKKATNKSLLVAQQLQQRQQIEASTAKQEALVGPNTPTKTAHVGRNELCPCGSQKKFKHCCGKQ